MTLGEAFSEYLIKGQQGQLVIKFHSDVHLCKILIENGEAVHITHGRTPPEVILETLPGQIVEWVNFIAGYPVRKHLDLPLHQRLLSAINTQPSATSAPVSPQPAAPQAAPAGASAAAAPVAAATGPSVPAEKVAETVDGLIQLIGPLGRFLADQVASSFSYAPGSPMPQSLYNNYVSALAKEIPKEMQASFLNKFKR